MQPDGGGITARRVHLVTCPTCDRAIELPADARPGDTIECCGTRYRLTYEYGAYALEPPPT